MILSAFDGLREGEALVLVSDHEPRPLRAEFEELRPGRYLWSARYLGSELWEVELRRLGEPAQGENSVEAVLRRAPAFAAGSVRTRAALAAVAVVKRLARGDTAFRQGVRWPYVGLVCEGTLAIIANGPGGRQHLLFEILPLETFGEAAALDGGATLGDATVISAQARIALVPTADLGGALSLDPALARAFCTVCAQRTRLLAERLTAQVSRPTIARIAAAILPYAPPDRGLAHALPPLPEMTQVQLAAAAGTVKEVASRVLAELEETGAIELIRGRVARTDRARLTQFIAAP
jgi:CRP-like cAMP-binding protein/uncharacterized protein (DUF2249 family)